MNPMPELSSLLKQLRLSGILETLPARNREAHNRLAGDVEDTKPMLTLPVGG